MQKNYHSIEEVKKYVENSLLDDGTGRLFYLGTILNQVPNFDEPQKPKAKNLIENTPLEFEIEEPFPEDITFKLIKKNPLNLEKFSGYMTIRKKDEPYFLSYATSDDWLYFDIRPEELKIITRLPQITKTAPTHPQAISKEDWKTETETIEAKIRGNYSEHRRIMYNAFTNFVKGKRDDLWLPTFFPSNSYLKFVQGD